MYNALRRGSEASVGGGAILGDTVLLPVYDTDVAVAEGPTQVWHVD